DLATPDYQEKMQDDLLWVYEGLTNYLESDRAQPDAGSGASAAQSRAGARLPYRRGRCVSRLPGSAYAARGSARWSGPCAASGPLLEDDLGWIAGRLHRRAGGDHPASCRSEARDHLRQQPGFGPGGASSVGGWVLSQAGGGDARTPAPCDAIVAQEAGGARPQGLDRECRGHVPLDGTAGRCRRRGVARRPCDRARPRAGAGLGVQPVAALVAVPAFQHRPECLAAADRGVAGYVEDVLSDSRRRSAGVT